MLEELENVGGRIECSQYYDRYKCTNLKYNKPANNVSVEEAIIATMCGGVGAERDYHNSTLQ